MKVQKLTALLPALLAGTLLASTATCDFSLDNVSISGPEPIALQTTDKIAYSIYWLNGDSASVTAKNETEDAITIHETSAGDLEGQCCWDYAKSIPIPKGGDYTLTHDTQKSGSSLGTLTKSVTITPEPALALLLGLLGLFLAGRRNALKALVAAAILLPVLGAKAATVSNVKACQRWPWNGNVDVEYTLEKDSTTTTETPFFKVRFEFEGNTTGTKYPITSSNFFGEGSSGQTVGAGVKKVTWKSMGDAAAAKEMVTVSVTAEDITSQQKYMKVDLVNKTITKDLPIPDKWTDDDKTKYMWFKWIPEGTFTMGSPSDEIGRRDGETLHEVTLTKGYWLGVFQMTQGQYDYITAAETKSGSLVAKTDFSYNDLRGSTGQSIDWPTSGNSVDSDSVLGKLRALIGTENTFDLPTEAQWEYACRAGNGAYKWNNGTAIESDEGEDNNLDKLGWYKKNLPSEEAQAVGQKLPSDWGLYDMHGNVFEWCLDWYGTLDSTAASDPTGPTSSAEGYRIVRGGSWYYFARHCRSAYRYGSTSDVSYNDYGVRVALVQ